MESFKNTFMIFVETLDGGAIGASGDVVRGERIWRGPRGQVGGSGGGHMEVVQHLVF